jgi:SecD/SecF fusion protein
MSEVLTRSLATTSCTLMPILALLFFGGATLRDFAFALLIGVASGAYSSIFIASPVLTHWKEREPQYRARRRRIVEDLGEVPPYAPTGADVEPARRGSRRPGRITTPQPDTVSAAEFEQMKQDIVEPEPEVPSRQTSTITKRRQPDPKPAADPKPPAADRGGNGDGVEGTGNGDGVQHAPDIAENEGVSPTPSQKRPAKAKPRNRRHGRPR